MTSTEIAVSIVAGLFALSFLATSLGAFHDKRKFAKRIEDADEQAAVARENSGYHSRKVAYLAERLRTVDRGIGRAIHRIIDMHSEEHCHRLANRYPESYLPDGGKRHAFIAQGLLRALNIVEEETGRYKEEAEEGPSPAYLNALAHRIAKVGKQLDAIKQSQEADRQRRQLVDYQKRRQAIIDRRRHISEARWRHPDYEEDNPLLSHQHQQPTAPYPTGPPLDGCKVCGSGAYTYRWGQCLTTFYTGNYTETARATVEWEKYDPNYDVGWFPVCAHHASVLDKHGTVTRTSHGRPPHPKGYREC